MVKHRIARMQMRIPFPAESNVLAFPTIPAEHLSQPAPFPRGWMRLSLTDPNWRANYARRWMDERRAAGLPHVVTQPLYVAALAAQKEQCA